MKIFACLLLLGLALSASAADVTGKWSGSFNITRPDGQTKQADALLDLKQNGSEITGTVGPDEGERYPIAKGKIEGNKITLESAPTDHDPAIKFELVVEGDHIKGDAKASKEGESITAKLDLTRVKS